MPPIVVLHQPEAGHWLSFHQPVEIVIATQPGEVTAALAQVEAYVAQGFYAAGFLSYEASPAFDSALTVQPSGEAGFPLLWFGIYAGENVAVLDALPTDQAAYQLSDWQPSVTQAEFEAAIATIQQYIASGDSFQVNYTFRLGASFQGDPWGLFLALMQHQPGNYSAFIETEAFALCSASPELFFRQQGETFTAKPMKGTMERGWWLGGDRAQAARLQACAKNQAENVMIVDMLRNDLGRIAKTGTVCVPRLFEAERYPTLWQMTSTVQAQSEAGLAAAMAALFPCASITGAPKARTMEIIRELECSPRQIYCGAIGHWAPACPQRSAPAQAQFNVAIRTVLIDKRRGTAEYGVGSGIVWDSDAAAEYAECCLKTAILTREPRAFELLETMLWQPEQGYFLLEYHLQRLRDSAEYFGYGLDLGQVRQVLAALALQRLSQPVVSPPLDLPMGSQIDSQMDSPQAPPTAWKVRLLVDAQGGCRIEASPWQPLVQTQPLRACLAAQPIDPNNPFLYHKTTQRQVYEQAQAARPGVDEVILWRDRQTITEGCIANVILDWRGELITPPISAGLLGGTFRAWLLDQGKLRERAITVDMLRQVPQFFLVNSLRQWQTAVLIDPPELTSQN
ncbi:MAG: aminodeoxychorismate synthase component I [Synechococcales cyanobacterium RM1_1_8]|nr:aminodeoxychorismate synthase component I [Synechococcales cyanobacterium RM1_1_8]